MKKDSSFYVISYRDAKSGKVAEIKAKTIKDSSLGLSFISISDFLFEESGLVVNPTDEQMKKHFEHVKSLNISIYTILSIEEVGAEHSGLRFEKDKSNLVVLQDHDPSKK